MQVDTEEFQVTLPSNACKQIYSDNNPAKFKVQLKKELLLNGEWEVAAVDVSYEKSFLNFRTKSTLCLCITARHDPPQDFVEKYLKTQWERAYEITDNHKFVDEVKEWNEKSNQKDKDRTFFHFITVPKSYYNGLKGLVDYLNKKIMLAFDFTELKLFDPKFRFEYNEHKDRIENYVLSNFMVRLDSDNIYLPLVLGQLPIVCSGSSCTPFLEEIHMISVHCDIIDHQLVGDSEVQKLSQIPVNSLAPKGTNCHWVFNPPYYIHVNKTRISTVEIQLLSEEGELVPFTHGDTVIRLHFRRKNII